MSDAAHQQERKKPNSYSELYPGRFLHADHLKGKHVTLMIADVDLEELHGEKGDQLKAIVAFEKTPLLLVLPKINGAALKAMFGPDVRGWVGKRVTLFSTADYAPFKRGEACIRVWGSPDIAEDIAIDIRMSKRKAFTMTLHAGANGSGKATPAAAAPEDDEMGGRM